MENNTPPTSSPPRPVKKENEEEIKEFAETAMNELLGWYGYERLELRRWAASRSKDTSSPENGNEQKDKDECSWCNKAIPADSTALQQADAVFCSEVCFSQSRRANFKRAKTCDWCRHVRHTVAYVDFQDGATQLQFCSDKCLNQYKMHIFCRETQAHLEQNPHLASSASTSNLITPELWMKNCRSRSTSPASAQSGSPKPETAKPEKNETKRPRKSPAQVISVTPTAKLMKKRSSEETQKSPEVKNNSRKVNTRKRRLSKCSATVTSQSLRSSTTPKAQDLRMCSPSTLDGSSPISNLVNSSIHSPTQPNPHPFQNPLFGIPPYMDMPQERIPIPGNMFPPRPNFIPRIPLHQERQRLPPPLLPPLGPPPLGQAPPVTVLVPYPVPIPIPLPIPIPIPMSAFIQAQLLRKVKIEAREDDNEGPLDFTMNIDRDKDPVSKETDLGKDQNDKVPNEKVQDSPQEGNPEQTLPKFKITRLGNKMAKIVTKGKEFESTRPLRKRRRLVEVATEEDVMIGKNRKTVEV